MPTYKPALRGVRFTEAYAQAAAVAPIGRAMLAAYELWHPTLSAPVRFVDDLTDLTATLEATAPRNASTAQTFIACRLTIGRPEESDTAASPEVTLAREGVSGILKAALDTARGSIVPWTLIERLYASDDPSGPAKLPVLTYQISQAQMNGAGVSIKASFGDAVNVSVPTRTFRREQYPGLA